MWIALLVLLGAAAAWVIGLKRRITWTHPAPRRADLPLAARVLGEGSTTVVLLHGLAGSGRYFGAEYDALAGDARLVVPDLLGFGDSWDRGEGFTVADHVAALRALLDAVAPTGPLVVVGHSTGCVLALALARALPQRIEQAICVSPVLYRDAEQARRCLGEMGVMVRLFAMQTPWAWRVCQWVCAHRRAAAWVAVAVRPDLPVAVARDGVWHTWDSYMQTLAHVIIESGSVRWLAEPPAPVRLLVGQADAGIARDELAAASAHAAVELRTLDGGHDLPLTHGADCLAAIREAMGAAQAGGRAAVD